VLLVAELQAKRSRLTVNISLIGIFTALWIALNLTVAPISFSLTGLPVIHSLIVFFTLALVVWVTGQFGAASFVGIIGSAIVLLAGGPLPVIGFVPASIIFDLLMTMTHHKINLRPSIIAVMVISAIVSSYVGAVVNGLFILSFAPAFTFTVWGGLVVIGGIIGVAVALPIIGTLERAQVKRVKTE
jgi:hypothetical protein